MCGDQNSVPAHHSSALATQLHSLIIAPDIPMNSIFRELARCLDLAPLQTWTRWHLLVRVGGGCPWRSAGHVAWSVLASETYLGGGPPTHHDV